MCRVITCYADPGNEPLPDPSDGDDGWEDTTPPIDPSEGDDGWTD